MKSIFRKILLVVTWVALSHMPAYGEIADAVYRDGVFNTYINHAALLYRYDNAAKRWDVIHSKGGGDYAANSVVIGTWSDFLAGNNFTGQKCPANISKGVRDSVLNDALDQLGAHYFSILNPLTACYKRPNSSPGSGDGCFRCDFLVEWCYEQNGYDICYDPSLYSLGPFYQRDRMPDAIQTAPYNVSMSYPSSTDVNNPTVSSSSSITLYASASDTHSGLSYNLPFDYYYAKYENGAWGSWVFLASGSGSRNNTILTANTLYRWYVQAFDNGGSSAVSSSYYFKWVPVVTVTIVSVSPNPGSVVAGNTFTINATVNSSQSRTVYLGASLVPAGTSSGYINDSPHDASAALNSGNNNVSRQFTVPAVTTAGTYDLLFSVYQDSDGNGQINSGDTRLAITTLSGAVTVTTSDTTPPTPNPSTWSTSPYATGSSSIQMVATTASDPSGVQYYFHCLTSGGHDSAWQASATYQDTGLSSSTTYSYQVRTRDQSANQNTGSYSTALSATTQPAPDTTPPTPNPSTWSTSPYATGPNSIQMVATTASDPSGVQYYFHCLTSGGHDSAWQASATYQDTGLSSSTTYSYQVRARDQSANQNTGSYSTALSATTQATGAPTLGYSKQGANMVLSWPANPTGFVLQSAPNVTGTYTDVPGATSPYSTPITGAKQFFRLMHP